MFSELYSGNLIAGVLAGAATAENTYPPESGLSCGLLETIIHDKEDTWCWLSVFLCLKWNFLVCVDCVNIKRVGFWVGMLGVAVYWEQVGKFSSSLLWNKLDEKAWGDAGYFGVIGPLLYSFGDGFPIGFQHLTLFFFFFFLIFGSFLFLILENGVIFNLKSAEPKVDNGLLHFIWLFLFHF